MTALKVLKACRHGLHQNVEALRGRTVKLYQDNLAVFERCSRCHPSSQHSWPRSRTSYLGSTKTRSASTWSTFAAKQIWRMLRQRGLARYVVLAAPTGPRYCSSPHGIYCPKVERYLLGEKITTYSRRRGLSAFLYCDATKSWQHLRKRCEDVKLLRCIIRPSLQHE
jgi:hypothetical protein